MSDTIARHAARIRSRTTLIAIAVRVLGVALALLLAANLVFFAIHAAHMLAYPYPLDYGEGPLLAQVNQLRQGVSIAQLYNDLAAPPYHVVNYPPVYHLATLLFARFTGNTLLAGRIVALSATFGVLVALWVLACGQEPGARSQEPGDCRHGNTETREHGNTKWHMHVSVSSRHLVIVSSCLLFLALPIVREWAVVMRVDMLGVCLGLWALVIIQRNLGRWGVLWAAPLLLASLFTKPSLIAAPAAALVWVFVRDRRRGAGLALLLALGGGSVAAALQAASGGWFLVHVAEANSNPWQLVLAYQFWRDQMLLHGPLVVAAILLVLSKQSSTTGWHATFNPRGWTLPLLYTLFGIVTAVGVGKVGAYANYFLEMYAGLIWLLAQRMRDAGCGMRDAKQPYRWSSVIWLMLLIAGVCRYYPTWSEQHLKLAGIIEPNPAQFVVGSHGVWSDLQREQQILQTLAGVNAALTSDARAANAPIFTDVPGVAAQAGVVSRLQAFEHRQLIDSGVWDQRPLLRDLANGRVPLVVLDYLGNWLSPEMIALVRHRYAQDGSRGTYDLYRPVDPGPRIPAVLTLPDGLQLAGYHLAPSPSSSAYHAGEALMATLELATDDRRPATADRQTEVALFIVDERGQTRAESREPLLYGALPPENWSNEPVQHMQTVRLPDALPSGNYIIALGLRSGARDLAAPQAFAQIQVEASGRVLENRSAASPRFFFVPAPLLDAWQRAGGDAILGEPLMPAVPFAAYVEQCFARGCLRLHGAAVERVPLGEIVLLGETAFEARTAGPLRGAFLDFWQENGGAAVLGTPISGEFVRGDMIVQYTRYARLERPTPGGAVQLARLGDDVLRLPSWEAYRWP